MMMQTEEIVRTDEAEQTSEPCNPRSEHFRCTQEAVWCLTMMCCGSKTFLCDEHNTVNNEMIALLVSLSAPATCTVCGTEYRGEELYTAEIVTSLK